MTSSCRSVSQSVGQILREHTCGGYRSNAMAHRATTVHGTHCLPGPTTGTEARVLVDRLKAASSSPLLLYSLTGPTSKAVRPSRRPPDCTRMQALAKHGFQCIEMPLIEHADGPDRQEERRAGGGAG